MDKPVALITGASQGLGRALADGPRRPGLDASWSTPAAPTASLPPRRQRGHTGRPSRRHRGRRHRPEPPRPSSSPRSNGCGRLDLLVNNASTLGASPLPALDVDRPRRAAHGSTRSTWSRRSRSTQALLPVLRGGARHDRERHVRRRGRGLRRLGRLRLVEGRVRAALRVLGGRASRRAGARRRSRRHAHRDAPGRVPRRGHLRPAARPRRSCPARRARSSRDQPSGRARVAEVDRHDRRRSSPRWRFPLDPVARGARARRGARSRARRRAAARLRRRPTDVVHATFADLPSPPARPATLSS